MKGELTKLMKERKDVRSYDENDRDEYLCRYKFGKCMNPRTYKINGTLHSLCAMHRMRQNAHQLKSDRKRRQQKSTPLTHTTDIPKRNDIVRSQAIGETLCRINANLLQLTQLLIQQDELSRVEGCSILLSLNPDSDNSIETYSMDGDSNGVRIPPYNPNDSCPAASTLPPIDCYLQTNPPFDHETSIIL